MRRHVVVATASSCTAILLVSYSGVESGGDKDGNADASASTAPMSVDPAAPKLTERISAYNFTHTNGDGSMKMLTTVQVTSSRGWIGLSDGKGQFTTLGEGKYTIQVRDASDCSGTGSPAAEELGVIGGVYVDNKQDADIWDAPSKVDEDSFTTVMLVGPNGDLTSCAKTVTWTEPTEGNDSWCEKITV